MASPGEHGMTWKMMLADVRYWSAKAGQFATERDCLELEVQSLRIERCELLERLAATQAAVRFVEHPDCG